MRRVETQEFNLCRSAGLKESVLSPCSQAHLMSRFGVFPALHGVKQARYWPP